MMHMRLWKVDDGGLKCSNPTCKHSLEYHFNVIGHVYYIKEGTTALVVSFSSGASVDYELYCRECIDILYQQLKPVLDSKLWAFN